MSGGASSGHLVAHFAAFNVTWQGVERFEEYADGRALMKEVGGAISRNSTRTNTRGRPAVA